jgi:hypothetical protein
MRCGNPAHARERRYFGRSASRPRGSWTRKYVSIKAKGRKPTGRVDRGADWDWLCPTAARQQQRFSKRHARCRSCSSCRDEMIKASISLQDLRRRLYVKANAETSWRFWGFYAFSENERASVGRGGVGSGSTTTGGASSPSATGCGTPWVVAGLANEGAHRHLRLHARGPDHGSGRTGGAACPPAGLFTFKDPCMAFSCIVPAADRLDGDRAKKAPILRGRRWQRRARGTFWPLPASTCGSRAECGTRRVQ